MDSGLGKLMDWPPDGIGPMGQESGHGWLINYERSGHNIYSYHLYFFCVYVNVFCNDMCKNVFIVSVKNIANLVVRDITSTLYMVILIFPKDILSDITSILKLYS